MSRPKEKTIFLWFMFVYSCICISLNSMEVLYLIYSYITKYSKAAASRRRSRSPQPPLMMCEDSKLSGAGGGLAAGEERLIKHMSEERERIKGHELVSVAGPHGQGAHASKMRGVDGRAGGGGAAGGKYGGVGWGGKYGARDIWKKESNHYKYPPLKFELTNSHEMSDYMYEECDDSDDRSVDDSEIDRIAPDQLDDINIEYNEIDINDLPMDDDVNDVMNNNDDCI